MTVRRTYECNLCHGQIVQDDAKRCGFGVYFSPQGLVFRPVNEAENHLCSQCAFGVATAYQKDRADGC